MGKKYQPFVLSQFPQTSTRWLLDTRGYYHTSKTTLHVHYYIKQNSQNSVPVINMFAFFSWQALSAMQAPVCLWGRSTPQWKLTNSRPCVATAHCNWQQGRKLSTAESLPWNYSCTLLRSGFCLSWLECVHHDLSCAVYKFKQKRGFSLIHFVF